MSRDRALAILALGSQFANYSKHMTKDEIDYINAGWEQMPGWTCFYDALVRCSKQVHPFDENGLLNEVLHVMRSEN